ncbi:hypothetical protein CSC70_07950 [Pseudoxanthomonas kalamensis DSM 18571]|uniref:DUF2939 domain-containing protein n=1 Tax=Pseudoxanthomonas kalamensis TaxID=289483 RepID=UPI0013911E65|nr:DUF2939 domain-containing protein [Pseudoxanthomonas kalamensis]KAF1710582.1 hypothetical protein CSC70_07950 [Pseudoxanthomonas kalamensis DSM 18571]
MKKWIALTLLLLVLALGSYVVAGPYLAMHGIRQALAEQNVGKLERHVDFAALRVSLRAQAEDYLARRTDPGLRANPIGNVLLFLAGEAAGVGVDTLVTPTGIAAVLQGRSMWKQATRQTVDGDSWSAPTPADPLKDADTRYESLSRFTATLHDEDGDPVLIVFTRSGLRWKLTDIRLPLL